MAQMSEHTTFIENGDKKSSVAKMSEEYVSEEYEVLIHDLRLQLQVKHHQVKKLEQQLNERREEIATLRNDYREVWDANQSYESHTMELKHQLSIKGNECKKMWSKIEQEVRKENKQLKEQLSKLRNKFETLSIQMNHLQEHPTEHESKENPQHHQLPLTMPGNIRQLVLKMIEQHNFEIKTLRQEMNENVAHLQGELENVIADKEALERTSVAEIERLNLALEDAANELAGQYDEIEVLKAANDPSDSEPSCTVLEIQVPTSAKQIIETNLSDEKVTNTNFFKSAKIQTPEQYGRWIEAKNNAGLAQISPLADLDDDYICQNHFTNIDIGEGEAKLV